jgi:NDP-sugar pyrophosphorylase family protein
LGILAHEVCDARKFGVIKSDSRKNMIDVLEKPKKMKKGLVNTGAYILTRDFFKYDLVSIGNGEYGLPQTLAKMAKDHKIKVEVATLWHPIGNPEDLKEAEKVLHKFV